MPDAVDITVPVNEQGHLSRTRREWLKRQLAAYAGKDVRIRITNPKRSSRANRYYWAAVIGPIRQAMLEAGIGFIEVGDEVKPVTAEMIHAYFKQKYLTPRTAVVFGFDVTLDPTTTTLDSDGFANYIDAIRSDPHVIELGVYFGEPGDLTSYAIAEPA